MSTNVNRSLSSIARGAPNAATELKSEKMFAAIGSIVTALSGMNLAAEIGKGLQYILGSPAAAAGQNGQTSSGQAVHAEKSKEAQGTMVTVKDPKEEALKKFRDAGLDVANSEVSDEVAKKLADGEITVAKVFGEIKKSREVAEKAKKAEEAAAAAAEAAKRKETETKVAEAANAPIPLPDGTGSQDARVGVPV